MAALGILAVFFITPTAIAQAPIAESTNEPVESLESIPDHRTYARIKAQEAGVNPDIIAAVIECESSWNPNAVGDGGNSFGLSQIHLPSWRGKITKAQAFDPHWSIDFMVEQVGKGNGKLWTCYRKLKG